MALGEKTLLSHQEVQESGSENLICPNVSTSRNGSGLFYKTVGTSSGKSHAVSM